MWPRLSGLSIVFIPTLLRLICPSSFSLIAYANAEHHIQSPIQVFEPHKNASDEPLLIIDGHNDFPIWTRAFFQNHIYKDNFTETEALFGQVDFPRLAQGRLGAQFWSVYVECPANLSSFADEVYYENVHDTLQQIDLVYRLIQRFPDRLQHAWKAADIKHQQQHQFSESQDYTSQPIRISSLLGIEGLHQIGNSASILRMYYQLGVRYATLTHTCHNAFADSEEPKEPAHNGLSDAGKALVLEMNRLGMMVDLSHTSFATQRDALVITRAPVIFSHSNAYSVCKHTRNVPDDVLFEVKRNGGVVMATFYPAFTTLPAENATLEHVVDHIVYMGKLIGYEHVGVGSDFDGMSGGPKGLEDVSKYPDLARELEKRDLSRDELRGVMGENVVRVLTEVEKVAKRLQAQELPLEDEVKPFFE